MMYLCAYKKYYNSNYHKKAILINNDQNMTENMNQISDPFT